MRGAAVNPHYRACARCGGYRLRFPSPESFGVCMDCEEVAEAAAKRKRMPKHLTDGRPCWCGPRVEVRLDGDIVIHNDHEGLP